MLAMPETGIGLVPDVGGTWLLSRAPGEAGTYLALTGARMSAADAIFAGFADTFVESGRLAAVVEALQSATGAGVSSAIAAFAGAAPPSELAARAGEIDGIFSGARLEAILAALAQSASAWAAKTAGLLGHKSPRAMKVALAALRQARDLPSLEAALDVEFRIVTRLFEDGEFIEGVRALLVDKDKAPKWRPATVAEVSDAEVARLMAPLPPGLELGLATGSC